MNRPQTRLFLVATATIALTLICLGVVAQARPFNGPIPRYVATTGSDTANDCSSSGSPCATVQHAIDQAQTGDEIFIAGGTYAPGGTVAVITKSLTVQGGFTADFLAFDPDLYHSVFDAGNNGSVISITNSGFVFLHHLTLTNGNGAGNCFPTVGCGGGIFAKFADLHIGHLYIHHNVANPSGQGYGGGIYANESQVEIWGSRITDNTANGHPSAPVQGYGGGICVIAPWLSLRESEIIDNIANVSSADDGRGGGIYLSGLTSGEILSNTIRGNSASPNGLNGYGNGIYLASSSSIYVAGNLIENNYSSSGQGGGIQSLDAGFHLDRNRIISNTSPAGGGVYFRPWTYAITLTNNLIAKNNSVSCCDGVYVTGDHVLPPTVTPVLVNNTIVHNGSHGVCTWGYVNLDMANNLIAFHDVGIWLRHPTSATVTADHNLLWNTSDPVVGTNAVQADPLLSARYGLREGSPALDAGVDVSWVTTDLEGNPRLPGAYDIGAFEGPRWDAFLPLTLRNY